MWPLYPSFIPFMKKHFPLDLVLTLSTVIEMSETRRNVIGWMYQFKRTFRKHHCIRNFNGVCGALVKKGVIFKKSKIYPKYMANGQQSQR